MEISSAVTSPVFSELVFFPGDKAIAPLTSDDALFKTLRTTNGVRPFGLMFLLVVPGWLRGEVRRKLTEALDSVTAKGFLDFLDFPNSPPAIRYASVRFGI